MLKIITTKSLFLKSGGFGLKPTIAGDYLLWKKFSKITKLHTYNIKIGSFRSWPGQDSKVKKKQYHLYSNVKYNFFSFRYVRLFFSLLLYPYIYLKTLLLMIKK